MPKYVLSPTGKIINTETNGEETIQASHPIYNDEGNSTTFFSKGEQNNQFFRVIDPLLSVTEGDTFEVLSDTNTADGLIRETTEGINKSHVFKGINDINSENSVDQSVKSFTPFNTFKDTESEIFGQTISGQVFADEFEMITGYRFQDLTNIKSLQQLTFATNYIISIAAFIALAELILSRTESELQNNKKKISYKLGSSIFENKNNVLSKFITDILNYPRQGVDGYRGELTFDQKLSAFILGFNSWLNPDAAIDYKAYSFIPEFSDKIELRGTVETFTDIYSYPIAIEGEYVKHYKEHLFETLITGVLSGSGSKRLMLLQRKMEMQKYWHSNDKNLFAAKPQGVTNTALDYIRQLNYYYFKFAIERMYIGIKLASHTRSLNNSDKSTRLYLNKLHPSYPGLYNGKFSALDKKLSTSEEERDFNYNWELTNNDIGKSSTSISTLPQLFNLTKNFMSSTSLGNDGKETIGELDVNLMRNFATNNTGARLPADLVRKVEERLESEYMPFYIQDTRTNEILSFYAFINNISDDFSPEYNTTSGFGRMDDVKTYIKTTRRINLTFTMFASSKDDHDLLWYKMNKLVSLVYPQWSGAYQKIKVDESGKEKFEFDYPFTRVPTSSPLIRLRVGDVIKSNYSPRNFARQMGLEKLEEKQRVKITEKTKTKVEKKEEKFSFIKFKNTTNGSFIRKIGGVEKEIPIMSVKLVKPEVYEKHIKNFNDNTKFFYGKLLKEENKFYFIDNSDRSFVGTSFAQDFSNIKRIKIPKENFDDPKNYTYTKKEKKHTTSKEKEDISLNAIKPEIEGKINNPITRSFESGMGKGLAGFIDSLGIDYNDEASTWEIDIDNMAPKLINISIGFTPIHDIPLGIDEEGMMTAPAYNVGKINKHFFGDVYDDYDKK